MNATVKKLWIDALRSGTYKQGRDALHRRDRFCCLGVLCDLAVQRGVKLRLGKDSDGDVTYSGEPCYLPPKVQKWAGIDSMGALPPEAEFKHLANANDVGKRFKTIANLIERYF